MSATLARAQAAPWPSASPDPFSTSIPCVAPGELKCHSFPAASHLPAGFIKNYLSFYHRAKVHGPPRVVDAMSLLRSSEL